jgi:hypothetical protein
MSNYDRPINYERDVIMKYDKNLVDDEDYINQKNDILNKKINEEHNIKLEANDYNPLFTPDSLIQNQFNNSRPSYIKTEEFNPYLNFLKKKGLDDQNNIKVRYNVEYINIDSLNRNKIPRNLPKVTYDLVENPLSIVNNKLQIKLNEQQIKNISIGDKISLTNIKPFEKIYSAYYDDKNTILTFTENKKYIQINTNANINVTDTLKSYLKYFDTTKVYIKISGVQGVKINNYFEIENKNPYDSTANNKYIKVVQNNNDPEISYIGNIPVSFINNVHQIYLVPPGETDVLFDENKFYILMPFASDGTNIITSSDSNNSNYNITFNFYHYNFIPINEIEADYPINNEHIRGFHIVKSINLTNNYIITDIYPPIDLNYINNDNYKYLNFGGNSIYFSIIDKIEYSYPNQNSYIINLNQAYNNVVQIKIIDSVFKNPGKTFYNTGSGKNNRLYFQSIENIEDIQYIEIDEGIYTNDTLKTTIETKFSQNSRKINTANFGYDLKYNMNVNINESTNVITFTSYKSKTLQTPINNIDPVININDSGIGEGTYTVVIDHLDHGVYDDTTVALFSGFIEHLGISASYLNGLHQINVIDKNRYRFVLNNVNLTPQKTLTNGGRNVTVFVPSPIKFYFNYPDTVGTTLGFRNPGYDSSVTNFNYIIKNSDPYLNELEYDVNGDKVIIKNKSIKLYKYDYFLMECNIVNLLSNANTKKNFFTKFRITGDNIISSELTETSAFFYDPIYELDKIGLKFYNPDNTLVEFDDNDHSFTLEITTIDNIPELTNINSTRSLVK